MAEESVDSLIIPGKSESGGSIYSDNGSSILVHDQKASFNSVENVKSSRRNSTGKPSPVTGRQKIVPHYLRASTGSCHDFCKYGRKQAFEEKKAYLLRKRTTRAPSDKQNSMVTTSQGERKKSVASKQTTADIRSLSSETKVASAPPEIIKREISTKKFEISSKPVLSAEKKMLKTEKRINISPKKHSPSLKPQQTRQTKKVNTFSEKLSHSLQPLLTRQSREKMNTISQKLTLSVQPKLTTQPKKSMNTMSKKPTVSVQTQLIKQSSPSNPLEFGKKMHKAEKGMKILSVKISSPKRLQPVTAKSSPSQIPGGISISGRREDYIKTRKNMATSGSPAKKTTVPPTTLSSRPISTTISLKAGKTRGSKLIPPPTSQNRKQKAETEEANNEKVHEKTLHVVEKEIKNGLSELNEDSDVSHLSPSSLSQPHSSSSLSSHAEEEEQEGHAIEEETEDEEVEEEEEDEDDDGEEEEEEEDSHSSDKAEDIISKNNTIANASGVKAVEGNHRKTLRKGAVFSESKDSKAVKLKFRRGKVVDVRSEYNGPRRLRFRRARVMEENHDGKSEIKRKCFKKKGDSGYGNDIEPSDKKVVLRHQDMQGKKDAQGLLNNVIEETASKLVESRKSKVKALVGAFETVISLHESKPSTQPPT